MATFTLNIRPAVLSAEPDIHNTSDLVSPQNIKVLENDYLGVEPTTITSINTTGFTLGTIIIAPGNTTITFTPNGNVGTSPFKYTITDFIGRTSETTVTITTIL